MTTASDTAGAHSRCAARGLFSIRSGYTPPDADTNPVGDELRPQLGAYQMTTAIETITIGVPADKAYRQCAQWNFLTKMFPGLTDIRPKGDGVLSCGLDLQDLPEQADVHIDDTGKTYHVECHGHAPEHHILIEFKAPETTLTRLEVRIAFEPRTRAQETELRWSLHKGLDNIRVFLETEASTRSRSARDPLLHTGPRVPPEA